MSVHSRVKHKRKAIGDEAYFKSCSLRFIPSTNTYLSVVGKELFFSSFGGWQLGHVRHHPHNTVPAIYKYETTANAFEIVNSRQ